VDKEIPHNYAHKVPAAQEVISTLRHFYCRSVSKRGWEPTYWDTSATDAQAPSCVFLQWQ